MVCGRGWYGIDTRSPNFRLVDSGSRDLPCLLLTDATDFLENRGRAGTWGYHDIAGQEFDFAFGHPRRKVDQGFEFGGIDRRY